MIEVTARELRTRAAEILRAVEDGERVTVTYRGRPVAEIRPLPRAKRGLEAEAEVFGMWRDRKDMKDARKLVRELRRPRGSRSS